MGCNTDNYFSSNILIICFIEASMTSVFTHAYQDGSSTFPSILALLCAATVEKHSNDGRKLMMMFLGLGQIDV